MHCHADLGRDIAVAAERYNAFDEVGRLSRDGERRPAQLRRRRLGFVERRAADQTVINAAVGTMHDRRLNAVGPSAAVFRARHRERSPRNLLGIETERRTLRRVASDGKCAGNRFGQEVIAEPRLVAPGALDKRYVPLGIADLRLLLRDLGHGTSRGRPRTDPADIGLERN